MNSRGSDNPMTGADLARIQETTGYSQIDLADLIGAWTAMQEAITARNEPIPDVAMAILARIYNAHPELLPDVRRPSFGEVHQAVQKVWPEYLRRHPEISTPERGRGSAAPNELAKTRMATWFGVQKSAAGEWERGRAPTGPQSREWKLLLDLVQGKGVEGLEIFLEAVDLEARSRGVEGGLDELMRRRSEVWPKPAWTERKAKAGKRAANRERKRLGELTRERDKAVLTNLHRRQAEKDRKRQGGGP